MTTSDLDPELVARLRGRDPRALAACYEALGGGVYRVCRGMLGQHSDAEDATQEVFLKLFERAAQFAGRARFSTWLHRLTVNHCLNRLEKAERRHVEALGEELEHAGASPIESAQRAEAESSVEGLLARLPRKARAVLVLRELEGLSYAEIAGVLDVPVGTVMSRLARARERFLALHVAGVTRVKLNGEQALPRPRSKT